METLQFVLRGTYLRLVKLLHMQQRSSTLKDHLQRPGGGTVLRTAMAIMREGNFVNLVRTPQLNKFAQHVTTKRSLPDWPTFINWMVETLTGASGLAARETKTFVENSGHTLYSETPGVKCGCSLPLYLCASLRGLSGEVQMKAQAYYGCLVTNLPRVEEGGGGPRLPWSQLLAGPDRAASAAREDTPRERPHPNRTTYVPRPKAEDITSQAKRRKEC